MAFSTAQGTSFQNAAGLTATGLTTGITFVIGMLIILWTAWMVWGMWQSWRRKDIDLADFVWGALRGMIVMMMITYFVR